ncbi:hypothetical protein IWQ60_005958 [Tieghemiomyces parasiticus]|uniref:NADP-dependent oxidoreductase domain-containing protein n=1 Tax=Tieghemiomyces parasiticus TaxID=78921 RepID=A0A9W8DY14_9FUNG|nr:hypothetical protein IWQ60_005958 [Tieghemiomyces parasiticus]
MTVTDQVLILPKLGFGAGAFSGRYNEIDEKAAAEAVKESFDLGNALHALRDEMPRERYILSTKVGRYGATPADCDYSRDRVMASVAESLRRLHTDYLDVVLCHDVEFVSLAEVTGQALPALYDLKSQGVIRQVGISGYPLPTLLRIAEIQHDCGTPLDVVFSYCHFNLHNRQFQDYAPRFRAFGVKYLINASPLSMGLLRASRDPPDWHPANDALRAAAREAVALCRKRGLDIAELATRFSLDGNTDGMFDTTVLGISNAHEIRQAVEWLNAGPVTDPVAAETLQDLLEIFRPFEAYTWPSP